VEVTILNWRTLSTPGWDISVKENATSLGLKPKSLTKAVIGRNYTLSPSLDPSACRSTDPPADAPPTKARHWVVWCRMLRAMDARADSYCYKFEGYLVREQKSGKWYIYNGPSYVSMEGAPSGTNAELYFMS